MGNLRLVARLPFPREFRRQGAVRTMMARRDHDEGLDAAAFVTAAIELVQRVDEHVDALVAELVPAADADEYGILGDLLRGHRGRDLHQPLARGIVQGLIFLVRGGREAVFKTVRGHDVHGAAQELGALLGRDLAHGREHVGLARGHLLQGMEGGDVETPRHLVPVEGGHVVIQVQVVAGQAASHHRRMGGEHGADRDARPLELQQAGARLPLVELRDGAVA